MQYEIEVGGRVRRVVVHRSSGRFVVEIDGRPWTVDARRLDAHSLSLLIEETDEIRLKPDPTSSVGSGFSRISGADVGCGFSRISSHEVTIAPDVASGQLVVHVGANAIALAMNGRRRSGRAGDGASAGTGPQRLVAPMPGKVVRVLVKPGDAVQPRQPLLVIEAMKMENELRAVRDGVVSELHAKEGQLVEAGSLLAVIAQPSA